MLTPAHEEYLCAMNDEHEGVDIAEHELPHPDFRCGFVALAGRPNVGQVHPAECFDRLSLVDCQPSATDNAVIGYLGIATSEAGQILYVDTPGLHRGAKRAMNRSLNRAVRSAISEVELAAQVIEAGRWTDRGMRLFMRHSPSRRSRVSWSSTKVDLSKDKATLLPLCRRPVRKAQFRGRALRKRAQAQRA